MSTDPSGNPLDLVGQIIAKLNKPVFLFALAVIIVVAVLGGGIPDTLRNLVYIVAIGAMLLNAVQEALPVVLKYRQQAAAKQEPVEKEPAPTSAQTNAPATASGGGQAATTGGTNSRGDGNVNNSGSVQGGVHVDKSERD